MLRLNFTARCCYCSELSQVFTPQRCGWCRHGTPHTWKHTEGHSERYSTCPCPFCRCRGTCRNCALARLLGVPVRLALCLPRGD